MRTKLGLLLILAICSPAAWCQTKIKLTFGSAGPRVVWVAPELGLTAPVGAPETDAATYEMQVATFGPRDRVFVWDRTSGNVAGKPLSQARDGWTVRKEDFTRLGELSVRVEHAGKPLAVAEILVSAGNQSRRALVSPADAGASTFFGLPPGLIKVSVTYKGGGKTVKAPTQTFDIRLQRDRPSPILTIVVDGDVEVIEGQKPAAVPASPPTSAGAKPSEGSVLGSIAVYLLGVAAAVAAGYGLIRTVQKNQAQVEEKLAKLGVSIPKDAGSQPDEDDAAPPIPAKPQPQQPIILTDADPTAAVEAGTGVGFTMGAAPVANPRLVREDGGLLLVPEAGGVLGRDAGVELSLPTETTLSRRHAELVRTGDDVAIRDLGSTNGTYVNGVKVVDAPVSLRPGDTVQLGAVRCRYEV